MLELIYSDIVAPPGLSRERSHLLLLMCGLSPQIMLLGPSRTHICQTPNTARSIVIHHPWVRHWNFHFQFWIDCTAHMHGGFSGKKCPHIYTVSCKIIYEFSWSHTHAWSCKFVTSFIRCLEVTKMDCCQINNFLVRFGDSFNFSFIVLVLILVFFF